jgi:hypothetical protein
MKRGCLLLMVSVVALSCLGQHANSAFTVSLTGSDRMTMVRNSIDVPSWHEKSFWPLYENYIFKIENVSLQNERSIYDLALTDRTFTNVDALNNARKSLNFRNEELKLLKESFMEIGTEMNGNIALQFIQTETLIRMMKTAEIFESTPWKKYRFNSNTVPAKNAAQAKRNTIAASIGLTPEEMVKFLNVYSLYELECNEVLGEDYNIYNLYSGEAADYTPGLAKRLGYNLVEVMQREVKLKEKYFNLMNEHLGATLAARFLAWEDYYSTVSKMYAWSDGQ